jgi:hypothetical protein
VALTAEAMDTYFIPDIPNETPNLDYPVESMIFVGDPVISDGVESPDYGFPSMDERENFDSFQGEDYLLI